MEVAAEVAAAATRVADESVVVAAAARARVTAAAAKATGAIWAEEGVMPGTPMATTSIAQFIRCNPSLNTMKAKRDEKGLSKRPPLSTRLLTVRGAGPLRG